MNEQFLVAYDDTLKYLRESNFDPEENIPNRAFVKTVMPELKLKKEKEKVIIEFEKDGYDGIMLYGRRNTEDHYTLLSIVNNSPYVDARPNEYQAPELREYKASFIKNKKTVGVASEFKIIVKR